MIKIEHLSNHPQHIEVVAKWLWQEWGSKAEENYYFWLTLVENSLKKEGLPQTFIALVGDEAVGTVGLWRSDLLNRQDLYPWLAALYIKEEYRGKGIGTELQAYLIDYGKKMGYSEIYLFAELNLEEYYGERGWEFFDKGLEWPAKKINIFRRSLV